MAERQVVSLAVDQPPFGGDNYPFVPRHALSDLLSDFYLLFRDDQNQFVRPFRLEWLYGFGGKEVECPIEPVHAYDLSVVDADGQPVFDSRGAYDIQVSAWGGSLRVIQWLHEDFVLRVVQQTCWEIEAPEQFDSYIAPEGAVLDDRTCVQQTPQLRSIRAGDGGELLSGYGVRFHNGYNTEWSAAAVSGGTRTARRLTLGAKAGSGKGKYPADCENRGILRVNGATPDAAGNLALDASTCYRIERPIYQVLSELPRTVQIYDHALQLFNDCGPCCECQDFINVYEAVRRLRDRYADMIARAQLVRDVYVRNRDRFVAAGACREMQRLHAALQPLCPCQIAVSASYCNYGDQCLRHVVMPISFQYAEDNEDCAVAAATTFAGTPVVTCNSTYRIGNTDSEQPERRILPAPYELGGAWPHYWVYFDALQPGAVGAVIFRLQCDECASGDSIEMIADAYSLPAPPIVVGDTLIPGYTPGSGPDGQARQYRLVSCAVKAAAGLLPSAGGDCC